MTRLFGIMFQLTFVIWKLGKEIYVVSNCTVAKAENCPTGPEMILLLTGTNLIV